VTEVTDVGEAAHTLGTEVPKRPRGAQKLRYVLLRAGFKVYPQRDTTHSQLCLRSQQSEMGWAKN
jgi:hypothetical protein